jgi:hypothetical protein
MAIQPTITGTVVANQPTTQNTPIDPFLPVVITTNPGGIDTLTIDLTSNAIGPGGTLSAGAGTGVLSQVSPGDWQLVATAGTIQTDLRDILFDPTAAPVATGPNAVTTFFALQDTSNLAPTTPSAVDTNTNVTNTVTGPVISGTVATQRTTNGTLTDPFAGVTITDSSGGVNTLTITVPGGPAGGNVTGTLSGAGITETTGTSGIYTVTAGTAASVTALLDAAVFTPTAGAAGSVVPTTFALSDISTGSPTAATGVQTLTNTTPTDSILFQGADGHAEVWQLNGANLIGGGFTTVAGAAVNPGTDWTAIGTGDFGASTSDILWQNSDGTVAVWQMNGTNVLPASSVTTVAGADVNPGTSWKAVGTGQFSHGADSDILLQNADSQVAIWNMTGSAINPTSGLATVGGVAAAPGTDWTAVGSGNFTADGFSDGIMLQSASTGEVAIWNMGGTGGTTVESSGLASVSGVTADPGSDWKAIGTGDFTGAGQSDIVLQNTTTSQIAIWDMGGTNGTSIVGSGIATLNGVAATPGTDWTAIGTGGVGDSDILFQNTTSGQTATWDMGGADGASILSSTVTSANSGPTLRAVGLTGGALV